MLSEATPDIWFGGGGTHLPMAEAKADHLSPRNNRSLEEECMTRQAGALQGWILTSAPWMTVFGVVLLSPVLPFMMKDFAHHPNAQVLVTTVLVGPAVIIALLSPFVG